MSFSQSNAICDGWGLYLSSINNRPPHPILHRPRVQLLICNIILGPRRRRLINLDKQFRKCLLTLLFREAVVVRIALGDEFPAPVRRSMQRYSWTWRRDDRTRRRFGYMSGDDVVGSGGSNQKKCKDHKRNQGAYKQETKSGYVYSFEHVRVVCARAEGCHTLVSSVTRQAELGALFECGPRLMRLRRSL